MWASIWSISRASLLVGGRNSRTISTIWSRVSISRVSLPWASNSASFLRSSASSRLTWKDSERRGISRGSGAASSGSSSGRWRQERVALGLVDDHLQAQHRDVVADLRLQLQQLRQARSCVSRYTTPFISCVTASGRLGLGHRRVIRRHRRSTVRAKMTPGRWRSSPGRPRPAS